MDILRDFHKISLETQCTREVNRFDVVLEKAKQEEKTFNNLKNIELSSEQMELKDDILVYHSLEHLSDQFEELMADENHIKHQNKLKETILKHFRKNRLICRFCPNQSSSKYCKKHTLCRLKGTSHICQYCGEHFDFRSVLVTHIRASHSKLLSLFKKPNLEQITKRGILPNMRTCQNTLNNYSKIR